MPRLIVFWLSAIVLVTAFRGVARALARRSSLYLQNTIIIGAGHIGQLAARKLLQHPEYRINLIGFVDADPRPRRAELKDLAVLGGPERLAEIVTLLDVERVIIAFSEAPHEELLALIRELRKLDVQIDVVPRLFEIVGPKAGHPRLRGAGPRRTSAREALALLEAPQAQHRLRRRAGDADPARAADAADRDLASGSTRKGPCSSGSGGSATT